MDILKKHVDMLGLRVRDKVTGFTGIVESIGFDLYGCVQAIVKPVADEKGDVKDGRWHDIQRLVVVDEQRVMPVPSFDHFATLEGVHQKGPAEKPIR